MRAGLISRPATAAAVFAGGASGALLRYWLSETMAAVGTVVTATVVANLVGSAVLGLLAGRVEAQPGRGLLWPLLGVGLAGALTTFSAFVVEAWRFLADADLAVALLYSAGSVVAGLWVASAARQRGASW